MKKEKSWLSGYEILLIVRPRTHALNSEGASRCVRARNTGYRRMERRPTEIERQPANRFMAPLRQATSVLGIGTFPNVLPRNRDPEGKRNPKGLLFPILDLSNWQR